MKIASWNVNSVRQRQDLILDWLKRTAPDVLMMQEIKCETAQFPAEIFREAGYECAVVGQKSYNGVATLVRGAFETTSDHLPGFENPAARYVEVRTQGVTLGNLYLPNGNSGGEDGYATKLAFLKRLPIAPRPFCMLIRILCSPETIMSARRRKTVLPARWGQMMLLCGRKAGPHGAGWSGLG